MSVSDRSDLEDFHCYVTHQNKPITVPSYSLFFFFLPFIPLIFLLNLSTAVSFYCSFCSVSAYSKRFGLVMTSFVHGSFSLLCLQRIVCNMKRWYEFQRWPRSIFRVPFLTTHFISPSFIPSCEPHSHFLVLSSFRPSVALWIPWGMAVGFLV